MKEGIHRAPTLLLRLQPHLYQLYLLLVWLGVEFHKLVTAVHVATYPVFLNVYWSETTQSFLEHYETLRLEVFILHFDCVLEVRFTRYQRQFLWFDTPHILEISGLVMLLIANILFLLAFFNLNRGYPLIGWVDLVADLFERPQSFSFSLLSLYFMRYVHFSIKFITNKID